MNTTALRVRRIPPLVLLGILPCGALMGLASPAAAQSLIQFTFRVYERPPNYPFHDDDGNPETDPIRVEATTEIDSIQVGQDFVVKVFVQDTRDSGATGVFAGYLDVNFDNEALAGLVLTLPLTVHPQSGDPTPYLHNTSTPANVFGNGASPSAGDALIDTDGDQIPDQINGLGSFSGLLTGTGPDEVLLVEFAMTAKETGVWVVSGEPTTESVDEDPNDAGQSPSLDCGLFGLSLPVCPSQSSGGCVGSMSFHSATLTIVPAPPPRATVFY